MAKLIRSERSFQALFTWEEGITHLLQKRNFAIYSLHVEVDTNVLIVSLYTSISFSSFRSFHLHEITDPVSNRTAN